MPLKSSYSTFFCICLLFFFHEATVHPSGRKEIDSSLFITDSIMEMAELKLKQSADLTGAAFYPEAYDQIWDVLTLADSTNNPVLKFKAYQKLAMLYSIFNDTKKAIASIDSMFYYAGQTTPAVDANAKINLHYSAAVALRMHKKYLEAKDHLAMSEQLLDSLDAPLNKRIYVLTEKAHLKALTGNLKEAENILNNISGQINSGHAYASILYSMWGDLYLKKGNPQKALDYYNKSLDEISEQNIRIGLKVELLEKASKINKDLGNYKISLEQIAKSKQLGDSLFGSQSARNKELFEIKDSHREAVIENQRIRKKQELKLLKTQKEKLYQRLIFSGALIVLTIIASIVVLHLLRRKLLLEKQFATERANTELEIKKKELAVTALQLMEKDKLLDEIKRDLGNVTQDNDGTSVEQIKSTINVNTAKTWAEFEARFIQVNSNFYDSLSRKHPDLSRNELKLCALIKLNFSSKEMAQLLGVSTDSVNKARYRLRKKLNLQRDDNLVAYINSI